MIQKAEFHRFKGLRNVALDLEPFTIIVGPNSSGKTSILEGLFCLCRQKIDNITSIHSKNSSDAIQLLSFGKGWKAWLTARPPDTLKARSNDRLAISDHHWSIVAGVRAGSDPSQIWEGDPAKLPVAWANYIPSASLLRLEATRLAAPSFSRSEDLTIDHLGNGLPTYLATMALNRPDEFQQLQTALREIVPSVRRIRFDRRQIVAHEKTEIKINEQILYRDDKIFQIADSILFDMDGADGVPAQLASEGTILVLGLLAVLTGPDRPDLFLLDDLERGLHPRAQRDLVLLLHRFLDQNPGIQIVATTHSPFLLNNVNAREVRLTALEPDGSTACARLDEHPAFEEWKDAMAPGEFWSLIGEQWIKGHPAMESVG